MCTSVPQMPARRTRISTSSSRIVGSATSVSFRPGAADAFTRAFTRASLQLTIQVAAQRDDQCATRTETSHGRNRGGRVVARSSGTKAATRIGERAIAPAIEQLYIRVQRQGG